MKKTIMERTGFDEATAELMEKELSAVCEQLKPLVRNWLETGAEDDDTMYEGYSLNSLKQTYDMYFTGAVLTLDWLIREPEKAKEAMRYGIK